MYIHQIVLRDVRGFNMTFPFWNDWTKEPLDSVLLTGPNGSGKTTAMRVIAALWDSFGEWLRLGKTITPKIQNDVLRGAGLAAIEIRDLSDRPLWLFTVSKERFLDELDVLVGFDGEKIGEVRIGAGRPRLITPGQDWMEHWKLRRERLQVGAPKAEPMPNMVFLEAETRLITPPSKGKPDIYPEAPYQWLVTYEAHDRWEGHIEAMLRNLKVRDPRAFNRTLDDINQFLVGKRLSDFDDTLRLVVRLNNGQTHYVDDLSAGERQCLIMMFMVSRWLQSGGVALIDEPDLHLHVSLQRHFIHELEKVVQGKQGQLIVTSHSPTLWEEYNERQRIELGERVHGGD